MTTEHLDPNLADKLDNLGAKLLARRPALSDEHDPDAALVITAAAVIRDLAGRVVRLTADRHQLLRRTEELHKLATAGIDLAEEVAAAGPIPELPELPELIELDPVELGDFLRAASIRNGDTLSVAGSHGIAVELVQHLTGGQ